MKKRYYAVAYLTDRGEWEPLYSIHLTTIKELAESKMRARVAEGISPKGRYKVVRMEMVVE